MSLSHRRAKCWKPAMCAQPAAVRQVPQFGQSVHQGMAVSGEPLVYSR